jgi:predicted RNA-binding protein YlxR (DUF448 family)/ribosomal protein L30E
LTATQDRDRAASRPKDGRTRMCAVTRRVLPERELVRFVATPGGEIVPDLKARLPGRGVWVSLDRTTIAAALRKGVFARALHAAVVAPEDLPDRVAALLRQAALGRLGLARKAGDAAVGFVATEQALAAGGALALVIAADGAEDGRRKIRQALHRGGASAPAVGVFERFGSEELGLALGRSHVIHAAVLRGPAGRSFMDAADRLERYLGAGGGRAGSGPESAETGE